MATYLPFILEWTGPEHPGARDLEALSYAFQGVDYDAPSLDSYGCRATWREPPSPYSPQFFANALTKLSFPCRVQWADLGSDNEPRENPRAWCYPDETDLERSMEYHQLARDFCWHLRYGKPEELNPGLPTETSTWCDLRRGAERRACS